MIRATKAKQTACGSCGCFRGYCCDRSQPGLKIVSQSPIKIISYSIYIFGVFCKHRTRFACYLATDGVK